MPTKMAMRVALIANVTTELLALRLQERYEVWQPAGFGAWAETALKPPAALIDFKPEAVVLALDAVHSGVEPELKESVLGALKRNFPAAIIFEVPLGALAEERDDFYDERLWSLARMPWSAAALADIAAEIEAALSLRTFGARKALALDLDGTLWRGVLGEDGSEGIEPLVEFQAGLKRLKERGIMLAVLSRNHPEAVDALWQAREMPLRADDFVGARINWQDKTENIEALGRELNLGLEAWVFLDDNPAERLAMQARHPEVAVPDFPRSPGELPAFLKKLERWYFPTTAVTAEDLSRTAAYRAEAERQRLKATVDFEDYLKSLAIEVDFHLVRDAEVDRVAQLANKTHQFNVNPHPYTPAEVRQFAADASRRIFTASVRDRYGEMGLVAYVQVRLSAPEAEIVDWVMSCRAMNRRIEFTVEQLVEKELVRSGVRQLYAEYVENAKNCPVASLFADFGFVEQNADTPPRHRYLKNLTASVGK